MANADSRVTIHMAASLDGFIARRDGSVDWLETADRFEGGEEMAPEAVAAFLRTIDCYVMGSRTYETASAFDAKGLGWPTGTSRPSCLPVASCAGREAPSSSTRAISSASSRSS
jgi:hypothetical protein